MKTLIMILVMSSVTVFADDNSRNINTAVRVFEKILNSGMKVYSTKNKRTSNKRVTVRTVSLTREQLEELLKQAREKGKIEGYREGYRDGFSDRVDKSKKKDK